MLSYPAIWVWQLGQRERGCTSDSPRGRRWITTLRKLPTTAPTTPARTTTAAMGPPPGSRRTLYDDPLMSRQEFWTMLALPYELIEMNALSSYVMFTRFEPTSIPPGPSANAPRG